MLARLAHWYLMRRQTARVTSDPGYRESLPGWGTVAHADPALLDGKRWHSLWHVVALDDFGNAVPAAIFVNGSGWMPCAFESVADAEEWLASPAASVVVDGDRPVTVLREYTAVKDRVIRGTTDEARDRGAFA